jgi:hypothetical protein
MHAIRMIAMNLLRQLFHSNLDVGSRDEDVHREVN